MVEFVAIVVEHFLEGPTSQLKFLTLFVRTPLTVPMKDQTFLHVLLITKQGNYANFADIRSASK